MAPLKFVITPLRGVASRLMTGEVHALISICDPDDDARVDVMIGAHEVPHIRLSFHDVDDVSLWEAAKLKLRCPEVDDIHKALDFLSGLDLSPESVVLVHCEAGISRSPSLAFGLESVLRSRTEPLSDDLVMDIARRVQTEAIVWDPNFRIIEICETLIPNGQGILRDAAQRVTSPATSLPGIFSW